MKRTTALALALACSLPAGGHRLDEYLQAARLGVELDRVEIAIDLTPGVDVADRLIGLIDTDHDGRLSEAEFRAYAEKVLAGVKLSLDEKKLTPKLGKVFAPSSAEMKAGLGMIRLAAKAGFPSLAKGPHQIRFENSHEAATSVYLVNALAPQNPAIRIGRQTRDETQRHYRVDFEVGSPVR